MLPTEFLDRGHVGVVSKILLEALYFHVVAIIGEDFLRSGSVTGYIPGRGTDNIRRGDTGSCQVFTTYTQVPAFAVCQITVVHSRKLHPDPKANSKHGTFHGLRKESVNATVIGRKPKELRGKGFCMMNIVAYMPCTSGCCLPKNQMWDVLLLVPSPLEDRGELVAKVSIRVQQRVKKDRDRVP